jgi:hypothetical protein
MLDQLGFNFEYTNMYFKRLSLISANTGDLKASGNQLPGTVDVESVNRPSSANPAIVDNQPTGNSEELMEFMKTLPKLF